MATKTWALASGSNGSWATAANWSPSGVPAAGDNVRIPAGTGGINAGLDQSAVALGDVIVESGYLGQIGSSAGYLKIDPDRFIFDARGQAFIDLGSAAIAAHVLGTALALPGDHGLYLLGSAITVLAVEAGSVALAGRAGETSTAGTVRQSGSSHMTLGAGCSLTLAEIRGGVCTLRANCPTVKVFSGELVLEEASSIATGLTIDEGGLVTYNSTGTLAVVTNNGGLLDEQQCGLARTITSYVEGRPRGTWRRNPQAVTVSSRTNYSGGPHTIAIN